MIDPALFEKEVEAMPEFLRTIVGLMGRRFHSAINGSVKLMSQLEDVSRSLDSVSAPSARLMIVGSSTSGNDASLVIRTGSSLDVVCARNDGRVGVGTTTPQSDLHMVGTVTISGSKLISWQNNTANTFLGVGAGGTSTTGTGDTANGYQALYSNTAGNSNNAYGYKALYSNTTGNYNVSNGYEALKSNTTGSDNTANGFWALKFNTTGNLNTAGGSWALLNNSTGNYNTAVGGNALENNLIGGYNTAFGYMSLNANTTGTSNAANGSYALYSNDVGSYNTATGMNALANNTKGNQNVAVGDNALYYNMTGNYNTATGSEAGYNAAGSGNVVLGYQAGYNETGTSTLYIANGSSTTLIYGNFASGTVGIGTTTPSTSLVVVGTITASAGDVRVIGGSFIDDGTTLTVPDYVFDADYPLKPLTQVKVYTQEHRHLEGIPDMNDKKGWASLSMQDRDMKLLEKIEELTLYLIQMKEENDAMKARILTLEASKMGATQCTHQ